MSDAVRSKAFRLVPTRNGIQAAYCWRFWRQGAEFYAAPRVTINRVKLSFHRSGAWQLQVDRDLIHLPVRRQIAGGWLLVLSLQWVILANSAVPRETIGGEAHRTEVPAGQKLVANLLLAAERGPVAPPAYSADAVVPWSGELRDGRRLLLHLRSVRHTAIEEEIAAELRHWAPATAAGEYGEVYRFFPQRSVANTLLTVPGVSA